MCIHAVVSHAGTENDLNFYRLTGVNLYMVKQAKKKKTTQNEFLRAYYLLVFRCVNTLGPHHTLPLSSHFCFIAF